MRERREKEKKGAERNGRKKRKIWMSERVLIHTHDTCFENVFLVT